MRRLHHHNGAVTNALLQFKHGNRWTNVTCCEQTMHSLVPLLLLLLLRLLHSHSNGGHVCWILLCWLCECGLHNVRDVCLGWFSAALTNAGTTLLVLHTYLCLWIIFTIQIIYVHSRQQQLCIFTMVDERYLGLQVFRDSLKHGLLLANLIYWNNYIMSMLHDIWCTGVLHVSTLY